MVLCNMWNYLEFFGYFRQPEGGKYQYFDYPDPNIVESKAISIWYKKDFIKSLYTTQPKTKTDDVKYNGYK